MKRRSMKLGAPGRFVVCATALLALGACVGKIGERDAGGAGPEAQPNAWSPAPAVLPRLTAVQYRNALVDLFGPDLPATPVEPDTNPYLFTSIGATSTSLSELGVQQLEEAATAVTAAVFGDAPRRRQLTGCESPDQTCVERFLETFGRRLYRRPLSAEERERWLGIAPAENGNDPWQGVGLMVAGMLQSPQFLYRPEVGEIDPDHPDRLRLTGWEMASRLSFLLWNTIPDDELLDSAERGDLVSQEGVEAQARRMIDHPRAREAVQEFFAQYFALGELEGKSRSIESYPAFSATLPESMRTEVKLLVDDLVQRRDSDVRAVFSTRRTFVNSELAALYGVEAPGASAIAFVPVELPDDGPRAGLLTLGAFLTMNAHETETSPTLRGKYLRERVLCQSVPPPPDDVNVDLTPEEGAPPATLRERLEEHRKNPACASCHGFIDPPGMLFENFDSIGAYRESDRGHPIDASGDLDGTPLAGAADLARQLENHPRVGQCIVTQLFRHAQGRLDAESEAGALEDLEDAFAAADYRFRELLVLLVTHPSFRAVAKGQVSP
jgi:hypothetical protein